MEGVGKILVADGTDDADRVADVDEVDAPGPVGEAVVGEAVGPAELDADGVTDGDSTATGGSARSRTYNGMAIPRINATNTSQTHAGTPRAV